MDRQRIGEGKITKILRKTINFYLYFKNLFGSNILIKYFLSITEVLNSNFLFKKLSYFGDIFDKKMIVIFKAIHVVFPLKYA